ncbi:GATA-type domain-containing protein [Mycena indigotica]|uniref:GATA-type domain-containing protein n=1 Tax=Mycena indigotica TaxID=2126181 RepID=A0A8H6W0X9_9AGAR|nr:GATA-type domain-containing protein [Mycena indigotica]KAF7297543.1 GATA-type domain-containing protein [Mycena indigotica]
MAALPTASSAPLSNLPQKQIPHQRKFASLPPIVTLPTPGSSMSSAGDQQPSRSAVNTPPASTPRTPQLPQPSAYVPKCYYPQPPDLNPYSHYLPEQEPSYTMPDALPGPGSGAWPPGIQVAHTDHAASKVSTHLHRRCFNCCTTEPPSWRRSILSPGKVVCNKCGLYERMHSRPRPVRLSRKRRLIVESSLPHGSGLTAPRRRAPPGAPYPPPNYHPRMADPAPTAVVTPLVPTTSAAPSPATTDDKMDGDESAKDTSIS